MAQSTSVMALLNKIHNDRALVLPDIQRDFVWNRDQIRLLFDSLMKGYPFGSLLIWETRYRDIAYRDFVGDADHELEAFGFGRAHHRVMHFVYRYPGLKVADLLDVLRITKQSLGRVQHRGVLDRRVHQPGAGPAPGRGPGTPSARPSMSTGHRWCSIPESSSISPRETGRSSSTTRSGR